MRVGAAPGAATRRTRPRAVGRMLVEIAHSNTSGHAGVGSKRHGDGESLRVNWGNTRQDASLALLREEPTRRGECASAVMASPDFLFRGCWHRALRRLDTYLRTADNRRRTPS